MCDIADTFSNLTQGVSDFFSGGGGQAAATDAASVAPAVPDAGFQAPTIADTSVTTTALPDISGAPVTSPALDSLPNPFAFGPGITTGGGATPTFSSVGTSAGPIGAPLSGGAGPSITASPVGAAGGGSPIISSIGTDLGGLPNLNTPDNTPNIGDAFGSQTVPDQALSGKPTPPTGTSAGNSGGVLDSIKGFIGTPKLSDLLGPALAGTGLALNASRTQNPPFSNELRGQAQGLNTAAAPLINGLQTGTLPQGLQTAIDEATAAQKAHIRSQYASMGLSGSTMELQALNEVDRAAEAQKFDQIQKLVQTGLSETTAASQIYQALQSTALQQDAQLGDAISSFAGALAPTQARAA